MKKRGKQRGHVIKSVRPGSIAEEMGVEPGDVLISINGHEIKDIFDYDFYMDDEQIDVVIADKGNEECLLEIDKEAEEDLGIEFDNYLMDNYRSCSNKCIFCFVDQLPKGMRETLYFKDDDSRLSFLQGNYVTLTNMSDDDIKRICDFHMEPINISVQTTEPDLRCRMLGNRFAGKALEKINTLKEAGIQMNAQVVLCRGINDREHLDRTLNDISKWFPEMISISIVPSGLTKFRDGLFPLEPFTKEDAKDLIEQVEKWQRIFLDKYGSRKVFASDEWYIMAERSLPENEEYEGFPQLENGVGMLRSLSNDIDDYLETIKGRKVAPARLSSFSGTSAYPYILKECEKITDRFPQIKINLFPLRNDFFGHSINVTGLLTGRDIIDQVKKIKETGDPDILGDRFLIPCAVLKAEEDIFLDDLTVNDVARELETKVGIIENGGDSFVEAFLDSEGTAKDNMERRSRRKKYEQADSSYCGET